jgi:peptide/nickel transport system permease protein
MKAYIVKRVLYMIITVFLVINVNFVLFRLMPGDPIRLTIRGAKLTPSMVSYLEKVHGFDKPVWEQLIIHIKNLLTFNLGYSVRYQSSVLDLLAEKMWNTIILLTIATVLSIILGILLGLAAGWFRGGKIDASILTFGLLTWSMPVFWLGLMFVTAFSGILPVAGMHDLLLRNPTISQNVMDVGKHLLLPTLVLTLAMLGQYMLLTRSKITGILTEDYIIAAKAKGLNNRQILLKHALKNASLPLVSAAALSFGFIIGGALQTEIVFSWPGIGRLFYQAALARDYALLQGAFYFLAISVLVANFLADITYKYMDPRIEY